MHSPTTMYSDKTCSSAPMTPAGPSKGFKRFKPVVIQSHLPLKSTFYKRTDTAQKSSADHTLDLKVQNHGIMTPPVKLFSQEKEGALAGPDSKELPPLSLFLFKVRSLYQTQNTTISSCIS